LDYEEEIRLEATNGEARSGSSAAKGTGAMATTSGGHPIHCSFSK